MDLALVEYSRYPASQQLAQTYGRVPIKIESSSSFNLPQRELVA